MGSKIDFSLKEMIKEKENGWWRIKRVEEYKNKKKKNCWAIGLQPTGCA